MTKIPVNHIRKIVEYLYHDQQKTYFEQNCHEEHIFRPVREVAEWLDRVQHSEIGD
jgi:hypothetical protein